MELSTNHLDSLLSDFVLSGGRSIPDRLALTLRTYQLRENRADPVLIISAVLPGSALAHQKIVPPSSLLRAVNDIPVQTVKEYRRALLHPFTKNEERFLKFKTHLDEVDVVPLTQVLEEEQTLKSKYKYELSEIWAKLAAPVAESAVYPALAAAGVSFAPPKQKEPESAAHPPKQKEPESAGYPALAAAGVSFAPARTRP